jgi:hypothetical protein
MVISNIVIVLIKWVVIITASLFAIRIVYIFARVGIAATLPETLEKYDLHLILQDVKHHFKFLLDDGYKIVHSEYSDHPRGGWLVVFESPDSKLSILLDKQDRPAMDIELLLVDMKIYEQPQIFLGAMIYFLTNGKVFVANYFNYNPLSRNRQLRDAARLLKAYKDRIEAYVRNDYERTKDQLDSFRERYMDLWQQEAKKRMKAGW